MGVFQYKIRCPDPDHNDTNASCAVYADGTAYCFGCNKYFKDLVDPTPTEPKYKEDINEKLEYIRTLPTASLRGIILPFDNKGYYLVWPSGDYYKLRNWYNTDSGTKYLSPSGHTKPLFKLYSGYYTRNLVIVEGEINAMSLKTISPRYDIISPGSATGFTDPAMVSSLHLLSNYDNILLCVDVDAAGLAAALKLKSMHTLRNLSAIVTIYLMEKDFNELLVEYGQEFKNKIKSMGMPKWVFND